MKNHVLFKSGGTDKVSRFFNGDVTLFAFGLTPSTYEKDERGALLEFECGDSISFERVLVDEVYDIDCKGLKEDGVMDSAPVLDDCGCVITLNACNNRIQLTDKGTYRAIYHGDNRPDITLIFHQNN